jgi:phage terminase large subunit-like protein
MSAPARSVPRSGVPARWATRRTRRATYGRKVAEVAEVLGLELLPWQRQVVDVALEHERGQLVYRDVVVSVPRQSGKSVLMLTVIVHRLLSARLHAVYGAQTRLAARQKLLDDWVPMIRRSPLSKLFEVSRATGQEALLALGGTGSRCRVISSDESAAHGQTASLGVLDEAWSLDQVAEQAVRPALVTKTNGQLWIASTAGTARSLWWRDKVETGREAVEAGRTEGLAYFEWSAEAGADLTDPEILRAFHPAVDQTIDIDTLRADIAAMPTSEEAGRAYGNMQADELGGGWSVFSAEDWQRATGEAS